MKRRLALAIPLMLAGCGTLPQPFLGKPGAVGAKLAVPPPPVLIVPPPEDAMLGNRGARLYAKDIAAALVKQDVPSIARPARPYDWQLDATASINGQMVTPRFKVVGPNKKVYGRSSGTEIPASAWANGDSAVLKAAAEDAAPALAKQLSVINASIQQSNPLSLENRPARVFLRGVTGAPGDGDHALALDVKRDLPKLGIVIVDKAADADFLVGGAVSVKPNGKSTGTDTVELEWTVKTRNGQFIGKVSQLHDLQPSEMTPYWGDVAAAAAQQAALGLKQVITNGTPKPPSKQTTKSASPKPRPEPQLAR